jgi:hypothetical protein
MNKNEGGCGMKTDEHLPIGWCNSSLADSRLKYKLKHKHGLGLGLNTVTYFTNSSPPSSPTFSSSSPSSSSSFCYFWTKRNHFLDRKKPSSFISLVLRYRHKWIFLFKILEYHHLWSSFQANFFYLLNLQPQKLQENENIDGKFPLS